MLCLCSSPPSISGIRAAPTNHTPVPRAAAAHDHRTASLTATACHTACHTACRLALSLTPVCPASPAAPCRPLPPAVYRPSTHYSHPLSATTALLFSVSGVGVPSASVSAEVACQGERNLTLPSHFLTHTLSSSCPHATTLVARAAQPRINGDAKEHSTALEDHSPLFGLKHGFQVSLHFRSHSGDHTC